MPQELTIESASRLPAEQQAASVLQIIRDAAANPAVDVAKMTELVALQERVMDRQARASFIAAETAMQGDLPAIGKRGEILNKTGAVQSRFSRWDDIHRTIKPILQRHGFSLSFRIGHDEQQTTVTAILSHVDGHQKDSGPMRLPRDDSGAKNAVQGVGSTVSYGKRYTTIALLNISTAEDDDGQDGKGREVSPEMREAIDQGEKAASCGFKAYEKWFLAQTGEVRANLVVNGDHKRLKDEAAKADDAAFPGDR